MARRRRTLYERYKPQAQAAALLRTSPERRGLRALLLEAQAQRDADISAARTYAGVMRSAIREARPELGKVYDDAAAGLRSVSEGVGRDFQGLGAGSGPIADAARAEAAGAQTRTVEARTRALDDLTDQGTRAAEGVGFAVRAAQDRYRSDAGKVLEQLTGLGQEEGLFAATELGRLVDAARGRGVTRANNKRSTRQSERNSLRSAGIDPDTGEPIPGGKLDPKANKKPNKGRGWVSDSEQKQLRQTIGQARKYAETFKSTNTPRSEAATVLSTGAKEQPVYDPKTGKKKLNKDGTPQTIPGVPAIKDELALSIALDLAYDGHLSRRNQRLLHKNRYRVGPLGVTTYHQWRKRNPAPRNRTQGANDQRPADPTYGRG